MSDFDPPASPLAAAQQRAGTAAAVTADVLVVKWDGREFHAPRRGLTYGQKADVFAAMKACGWDPTDEETMVLGMVWLTEIRPAYPRLKLRQFLDGLDIESGVRIEAAAEDPSDPE